MEPDVVLSKKVKAKAESGRSRRCHNKKIWNTGPTTSIVSRGSVFFLILQEITPVVSKSHPSRIALRRAALCFDKNLPLLGPPVKKYSQKG